MTRYKALDAMRGLTIALMILVNTPGSWSHVYAPLLHADWHGCTPTDVIFPFFMFIIGSAMFFSFKKTNSTANASQVLRLIKRGAIIFAIGLALNIYPFTTSIENLRILGVLQRIGIAYILASICVLLLNRRGVISLSVVILIAYWLLLLSVGPNNAHTLENNLVRTVDIAVLGESHLWQGKGLAFDPEGLLSTLPSVVSVLFGFEVTRLLTSSSSQWTSIKRLLVIGVVGIALGQLGSLIMPINKSLWTSTFVIYTSGIACIVLAFFVWLCDIVKPERIVNPLIVYGSNPLFIYVLSGVWVLSYSLVNIGELNLGDWMYDQLALVMSAKLASFTFALLHVIGFWLISNMLYKRKIFIKI
ncbi:MULTISPECIES: acyltransferase family protein [unclassified Pseudoalteromonas]|uniref:acyltransferase family protein n=1 Tax=unclassified Pseudoalteromonas TaxID=194690 RepID=UPI0004919FCA|nr:MULTISPECIES: heparan-alpha-glucosaminide N-acetyltransferase domain-containing protein [unclassified Pseudoalteromonas]